MKSLFCIITLLISTLCISQKNATILKSNSYSLNVKGYESKVTWTINPKLKENMFEAAVSKDKKRIIVTSGQDSIKLIIKLGQTKQFIHLNDNDSVTVKIVGVKAPQQRVTFTKKYIKKYNGKTLVETTPMYELVNVIIALTDYAQKDRWLVKKGTEYYNNMEDWFKNYKEEGIVKSFDSILKKNLVDYFSLRNNAYTFNLKSSGVIKRDPVFHSIEGKNNITENYLDELGTFAKKTDFLSFYQKNIPIYESQKRFFSDSVNTSSMIEWLNRNFPGRSYNVFKVIFSPLVFSSQNGQQYRSNNFTENQAHINFPYLTPLLSKKFNSNEQTILRAKLLFTEFNHSYINPEANKSKYRKLVDSLFILKEKWVKNGSEAAIYYKSSYMCFNEYMNWGLIALWASETLTTEELNKINVETENEMYDRGFIKFKDFNSMLLELFKTRDKNETLADLYPRIIEWFQKNDKE
ncbi:MAG: hypothetical protein RLZZ429_1003 [Bacteroidota bacterium]